MARIVLGPLVNDIRGSVGNQVFDNYNGVHVIRAKPSVINNPQTEAQMFVRFVLSILTVEWQNLDLDEQLAWKQLTIYFPQGKASDAKLSSGGLITTPRGPFSGWNCFLANNMNRFISQYPVVPAVLTFPPIGEEMPEPVRNLSAVAATGKITVSWTYLLPGPSTDYLQIWIKSVDAMVHGQVIYTIPKNANGSYTITQVKSRGGLWITPPRGTYKLQAQIIDENGFVSAPSRLVQVRIKGDDVFTYLASPTNVLSLPGQVASIARTVLDLSTFIPAGAHSAILRCNMVTAVGATLGDQLRLYRDAVPIQSAMNLTNGQALATVIDEEGVVPISTTRTIDYVFDQGAGNTTDLYIYLVGYIS